MMRLLKAERLKNRGRFILPTVLALTAMACIWALYGDYGEPGSFMRRNGYMLFLYQLPLVCSIVFPLICTVIASRLAEIEHKGGNLKLICTMAGRGGIFDAKLIYGLAPVLLGVLAFWAASLAGGLVLGFGGQPPLRLYLMFLLFITVPTAAIYILQHGLSMLIKNQAVPLCIGALGEFAGLFSMFLPQFVWLRRLLPWGWYGALQFVGLFGWTKELRYEGAYFENMDYDWLTFAVVVFAALLFYAAGRTAFCRKEI